jgi:hypothetical protein
MEYHEVYHRLAEKYHLVGDEYFLELLQVFMTLEEGKYVLELAIPSTLPGWTPTSSRPGPCSAPRSTPHPPCLT